MGGWVDMRRSRGEGNVGGHAWQLRAGIMGVTTGGAAKVARHGVTNEQRVALGDSIARARVC